MKHALISLMMMVAAYAEASAQDIRLIDGYAYPPIGGGGVAVAYVTLENTSQQDRSIVSATSDTVSMIELHEHIQDGDVLKMRKVDSIMLPAGQRVEMKPGGLHLMLMGVTEPMNPGDELKAKLQLDEGSQEITIPVKARRSD